MLDCHRVPIRQHNGKLQRMEHLHFRQAGETWTVAAGPRHSSWRRHGKERTMLRERIP
jgi:hypothetical protein